MPTFSPISAGQFCRDLACGIDSLDDILADWELTPENYHELRQNAWFQKELIAAVNEVKDLGPNSAYIMKCRGVAEATLPNIYNIIKDERVDPSVRVSAYKQITELGRLNAGKSEATHGGPAVIFNFGDSFEGIPKSIEIQPDQCLISEPTTPPQP